MMTRSATGIRDGSVQNDWLYPRSPVRTALWRHRSLHRPAGATPDCSL